MPEQLTRHPEVTIEVLRSAGAQCGEGAPQAILTRCPPQRFCKLPGGEMCIYGLEDAPQMTQISVSDWTAVARALSIGERKETDAAGASLLVGGAGVLTGLVLGIVAMRLVGRARGRP